MLDNARDPDNVVVNRLFPDATNADSPTDVLDFCSNGFKYRQGGGTFNQSGGTYIYVAFAENPFKYANAR
jgi:hypothetical protein